MSFLAWIVLGLIEGFIGSKLVNRRGEGTLLDMLLGVVGAFAGGRAVLQNSVNESDRLQYIP